MGELINETRVCNSGLHNEENVPLIWTFAFDGKEYWCPACGKTYGMLGAGKIVKKETVDMESFYELEKKGKEYLNAIITRDHDDRPLSAEKQKIIKDWKYKYGSDK